MFLKFAALGAQTLIVLISGCTRANLNIEPSLCYFPNERFVRTLPKAFSERTETADWAKELKLGKQFSNELDLYRAITCYKRASFLLPPSHYEVRQEISYDIFLSYYLGRRHLDALTVFDTTPLKEIPQDSPVTKSVLITLYDLYHETRQEAKKQKVLEVLGQFEPETALNLQLHQALSKGQLKSAEIAAMKHPSYEEMRPFFSDYRACCKSPVKARFLNALLPGAGYLYVGQRNTAFTSLLLNVIFTAATVQFVQHKLYFPAVISGSLECGWYFGGIQGAGLAAKAYNEGLYEERAREVMIRERLFPILMLERGF